MKHGHSLKGDTPIKRTEHQRKTITIITDPEGDFTGLAIGLYEFVFGIRFGSWSDGTEIQRGAHTYTLRGKLLYTVDGNIVNVNSWIPRNRSLKALEAVCR